MKRTLTLMLLTLFATSTFAQPPTIKRTDRLLAASGFPRYRKGRDFNVPFIETFKYGFLGCGAFVGWRWLIYSFVFMLVLLSVGIVVFNKVQKSFMDTV